MFSKGWSIIHARSSRSWSTSLQPLRAHARELEDQLVELKEQLDKGVITQEEYEQKEKKLLEELE